MPGQEIILRLLDDGPHEIQPLGDAPRLRNLLRRPLARPPIIRPALVDHVVHCPHRLLDRGGDVGTVAVEHIDVIHVQSLQRVLCPFNYVLPREAFVVRARPAPEDLGGDDDVGSLPPKLLDRLAHDLLGAAIGVDLGIIEEVDAMVAAALEDGFGLLDVELVAEGDPGAVGELRNLEARSAQVLVLHDLVWDFHRTVGGCEGARKWESSGGG